MMKKAFVVMAVSLFVVMGGFGSLLHPLSPAGTAVAEENAQPESAAEALSVITLKVDGMTCGNCEKAVNTVLKDVEGVQEAKASLADGNVEVKFDSEKVTAATLVDTINQKTSFEASLPE